MTAATLATTVHPLIHIPTAAIPRDAVTALADLPSDHAIPFFGPFNLYDLITRLAERTPIATLRVTTWRIDPAAAFALRDALLAGHIRSGELWIGSNASAKTLEGAEAAGALLSTRLRVIRSDTHAKIALILREGLPPLALISSCNLQLNVAGQSSFTFAIAGDAARAALETAFASFAPTAAHDLDDAQLSLDL